MKHLNKIYYLVTLFLFLQNSVMAQLTADFSATPIKGCAPLLVNFYDHSTGSPNNWKWDLGNGTVSFLQNPSVSYVTPGQYKITLIAGNNTGSDTIIKEQYITVYAAPLVSFTGSYNSFCLPLPVQFTSQSSSADAAINSWKWDFGDGSISYDQSPQHIYTISGSHDVTLKVTTSGGCTGSSLQAKFITIADPVSASFTIQKQNSCNAPLAVNFQNTTTGPALSYQWDFGDGTSSSLKNPSHIYTKAGNFTAQLTATSSNGCVSSFTQAVIIGSVVTNFTPDTVCPNKQFVFNNISSPVPANVSWNFGDNTYSNILNPKKSFSVSGNYKVLLVADYGACLDSFTKVVTVLPKPSFTADDTASCKAPFTVTFTSNLPAGQTRYWNFGDGTPISSALNPSHTYTKAGVFDVTLTSDCQDVLQRLKYIKIQPPVITLPNFPIQNCIPFTDTFNSSINTVVPITQYSWDFGDGATSALRNPSHTYNTTGSYTVGLTITTGDGCSISKSIDKAVMVGTKPTAAFTVSQRVACAKTPIQFTDQSTGGVNQWLWYFGDGFTSNLQNPVHSYNTDTGYFQVALVVRNTGCPDMLVYTNYIYIKPPIANFSAYNNCVMPTQKTFVDRSIGVDTWSWTFGDMTTSSVSNPSHIYADTGTYTANLTVTNFASGCTNTTSTIVRALKQKAAFSASDTMICKNSTIVFQVDKSINPAQILNYAWSYGDGATTSLLASLVPKNLQFTHLYTKSGLYDVRLIITDILGCNDTLIKTKYIKVDSLSAQFVSTIPGACLNSVVGFLDSSLSDYQHPIVQWAWDYGDGATKLSQDNSSSHLYTKEGEYTTKLRVTDTYGCSDSLSRVNYIAISRPKANFSADDTISCPQHEVKFTDLSSGDGLTYLWSFGDSSFSTTSDPVHSYFTTDTFSVRLKISDQYGCSDSIERKNYITVVNPVSNFSMSDSISTCPPFFITFNNHSINYTSLHWDFGDGNTSALETPIHSYYIPGIYTVTLTVTSAGGCIDIMTRQVTLKGPNGKLQYSPLSGCNSLGVNFSATTTNNTSFIWDFNDGNTTATTDSIISHKYIDTGNYIPKMILIDGNGCHVAITGTDTIKVFTLKTGIKTNWPQLCDSGSIQFADSSYTNGTIASYLWNFGDGSTSTDVNPVHDYKSASLYYPELIVTTQNGCIDSIVSKLPVKVYASPKVKIETTGNGCTPLNISYNSRLVSATIPVVNWNWDFANGNVSTLQSPVQQTYSVSGKYTVQLKAAAASGCTASDSIVVEAYTIPVVSAGNDTVVCLGKSTVLKATGADSYKWNSENILSCYTCANTVATPLDDVQYNVIGTTVHGCSAAASVNLKVQRPFTMQYSNTDSICKGSSVRITASGAAKYSWTPIEGLSNAFIANPTASPDISTTYKVIGTDVNGCFKDTGFIAVKVFSIPTVNAGLDTTINVGQAATLIPVISNDVTKISWSPTADMQRDAYPAITVKPTETTNYQVEVVNAGGCEARDEVTVYVICNGANVFVPNTFSPNGDGVNDVFYPRGTGLFKIKMMRIFNRSGQIVFAKNDFNANDAGSGWDGTLQGVKAATDVYIYMMDIVCDNNGILTYKGNIALIR